jgi:SAM-dependent methyltransferase
MMKRVLEPEVMDNLEQAVAYARADFSQENQGFVDRFVEYFPDFTEGHILDLGCGPADIPIRLVRTRPGCRITAVDASLPMIRLGEEALPCPADAIRLFPFRSQPMRSSPIAFCIICRIHCIFGTRSSNWSKRVPLYW